MKVNIENVFESKEKFPDEVISGIAEATSKVADMIPSSVFAGWTEEQIKAFWQTGHNFMIIGAGIAMDYMKNKCKEYVINNQENWIKWTERKPKGGEPIIAVYKCHGGFQIAHFGTSVNGIIEKMGEGGIDCIYWTYLP